MGGKKSLDKGKRAEREIIKQLQPIVDKVYGEFRDQLQEDPPLLQRNTIQSHRGGYDIVGLEWFAPEVKHHEMPNVNSWWKQTTSQASKEQMPVLFYKQNRKPWRVVLRMYLSIDTERRFFTRAEIKLVDFLVYFEHRLRQELESKLELVGEVI